MGLPVMAQISHLMIAVLQGTSTQTKNYWLDSDLVQDSEGYDSVDALTPTSLQKKALLYDFKGFVHVTLP